jgi:hypothetical protein
VLFEASKKFKVTDKEIFRAIHDAPSFSDHFHYGRERYVAFFQAALMDVLQRDNVVYHGLAGHFFIQGISHGLKVRIITRLEERVRVLNERENLGARNAAKLIKNEDRERKKWSRHLYGIDTWDPSLYDMVLNIHDLSVEEAAEIICNTVRLERFQTTPESLRKFDDLLVRSRVIAVLVLIKPDIEVSVENGRVSVVTQAPDDEETKLRREIESRVKTVSGVEDVEIQVQHSIRNYD